MADQIEQYLKTHAISEMLNGLVNELVESMPKDPINFLISGLLKEAASRGQEPDLLLRLQELKQQLLKDQKEASGAVAEKAKLEADLAKAQYNIKHLRKTIDELEAGGAGAGAGASGSMAVSTAGVTGVPPGHTPFSWAGGVTIASAGAASGGAAAAAAPAAAASSTALADPLATESFSKRVRICKLLGAGKAVVGAKNVTVCGWARTIRQQAELCFIALNDGSCMGNLQLVIEKKVLKEGWDELKAKGATGCSITATGTLVESPAAGQAVEMQPDSIEVIGTCDPTKYPIPPARINLETLRGITHMRPRTNIIGAVMRIRNALAYATHAFFQKEGFMYCHSPLITGADCEGAGEMFQVTTLDLNKELKRLPKAEGGGVDYKEDFFGKPSFLTVSGQLNAEHYACAFGSVYTFGPTFRAEHSVTARHLAEFWMIEPEMCFTDIEGDMNCAEGFLRFAFQYVLDHCDEDLTFLSSKYLDPELKNRLKVVSSQPFVRITYTEAMEICDKEAKKNPKRFEYPTTWGLELQTEHERYLAEEVYKKPVIVYNYPKGCKAFYMRCNDGCEPGRETVAAMDVLFPKVGEMVGGSQREERLDVLLERMKEMGLNQADYEAYLDLRRFGTQKHAGFGVGFERLVLYATAMGNIRDVIPFPRTYGQMQH